MVSQGNFALRQICIKAIPISAHNRMFALRIHYSFIKWFDSERKDKLETKTSLSRRAQIENCVFFIKTGIYLCSELMDHIARKSDYAALPTYLPACLPQTAQLPTYLPKPAQLPTYLPSNPTYLASHLILPAYLPYQNRPTTYKHTYLPNPAYLPTYLPTYLTTIPIPPTYPPSYIFTYLQYLLLILLYKRFTTKTY